MRALLCVFLVACGPGAVVERRVPSQPAAAPAAPVETIAELRRLVVADDDFYRPVLYTWTTPESIARLRTDKQLLVATASSGTFTSPFNRALAAHAASGGDGSAIARMMTTNPSLVRRRYAWPAPYATVRGLGPQTYGSALVRIELRPDAWIGRYDPAGKAPWQFVDAHGKRILEEQVLREPERVGAIFHVRTDGAQLTRFREYVVVGAVARWSVATPQIREELEREARLLRTLRDEFSKIPRRVTEGSGWIHWSRTPPDNAVALWNATLAFDNKRYRPTPHRVEQVLDALSTYDPAGEPLDVPTR